MSIDFTLVGVQSPWEPDGQAPGPGAYYDEVETLMMRVTPDAGGGTTGRFLISVWYFTAQTATPL
jgi:hypothetical protein